MHKLAHSGFGQTVSVSLGAAPRPFFAAALVLRIATSEAMFVAGLADMVDVWTDYHLRRQCCIPLMCI